MYCTTYIHIVYVRDRVVNAAEVETAAEVGIVADDLAAAAAADWHIA